MLYKRFFSVLGILVLLIYQLQAQIITTEPVFPVENQSVVIYYDATLGNQGLMGYTGDVYAHTGVITNLSSSPSDWRYVKTNWGENTPETKLERISANYYKLVIAPDIRSYYGVPSNEQILKMAFVFRSGVMVGGAYKEGKDVGNADIFVDVYPPDLSINITSPQGNHLIEVEGDTILVHAISPQADSMWLFENGNLRKAVAGLFLDDTIVASPVNGYWNDHHLIFVAKNAQQTVRDTLFYTVIPQPTLADLPVGATDGINYIDDSTVILCLQAPGKKNAFVIGDFNNWEILPDYYMNKTADGERFWIEISSLIPAKEYIYQYLVDGKIRISDPYSDKISDPWNDHYISASVYPGMLSYPSGKTTGIASVLQTAQADYSWEIQQFSPTPKEKLVIYELLIRDFTTKHTYQAVIDTLDYLVRLGVNAIELMPVMEFDGNSSWGYNPMTYFAPDKYYGPKNDLKKLIDECHKRGLAVILDIVLNHAYGNNPLVKLYWDDVLQIPSADNPWFNQVSPNTSYSWGYDFNHESPYTKQFVYRVTRYWLTEYKADGFRFDFSKGFTNKPGDGWAYDASRIAILKNYADSIWAVNPQAYVILEHFTDNSEEKILANYGMMLWGNLNGAYCDASMGYTSNSDFSWIDYQRRGWNSPHVVGYMESHDEERLMYKNLTWGVSVNPDYDIKDMTIALERAALAATFFISMPGPKMIWQFGELGYDYSIDYNGRLGEKPVRWDYYKDWRRHYLYEVYSALNHLKNKYPVFSTTDYSYKLNGADRRIVLQHSEMDVVIAGNFDVYAKDVIPGFTRSGKWYEFFSGDSLEVQNLNEPIAFEPGEYHLWSTSLIPKPSSLNTGYLDMKEQTWFRIWPNPAKEKILISFNLDKSCDVEIIIYNLSGQKIGQKNWGRLAPGSYTQSVSLSEINGTIYKAGVYIIELRAGNRIQHLRLALNIN
jgi:glycosidase